jgi:hypothetical protein
MLRLLSFATLLLVAVCLVLGATIALADDSATDMRGASGPADILEVR